MKFQKSVDLGGIYFAKVELTLKFDQILIKSLSFRLALKMSSRQP